MNAIAVRWKSCPPKVMQREKHNCISFFPGLFGLFKDKLHSLAIDLVPGWDNSSCSLFNNVLHELMTSRITVSGCLVSTSLITLLISSLQYISISISLLPLDGCKKKRNIDVRICILSVGLAQCSLVYFTVVPSKWLGIYLSQKVVSFCLIKKSVSFCLKNIWVSQFVSNCYLRQNDTKVRLLFQGFLHILVQVILRTKTRWSVGSHVTVKQSWKLYILKAIMINKPNINVTTSTPPKNFTTGIEHNLVSRGKLRVIEH